MAADQPPLSDAPAQDHALDALLAALAAEIARAKLSPETTALALRLQAALDARAARAAQGGAPSHPQEDPRLPPGP
ncbi:hypothetical protein ACFQXB_11530 [Plastorhodobacter daqingensis]|uniref:Uncharacterized protein n=1 Tax=Plastorhodobacter daqingensis TaxID=1387281 RepID=A0ABW2UJD5_9RHOB